VRVLLFATAREAAGGRSSLELAREEAPARVGDLFDELEGRFPALKAVLRRSRIAVNGEYLVPLERSHRLAPGDEVAVLPPYSGG
jgi:molybdopterin converting factor small subunit